MENPGKIVKKIAIALFVIMVILSIILAKYVGDELPDRTEVIGAISTFIIGVAVSACFSVLIYAFGELVEKTSDTNNVIRKIESHTRNLKITYQDEQATKETKNSKKNQEKPNPSSVNDKLIANDLPIYTPSSSTTCDSATHKKYKDNLGNNIGVKTKDGHWEIDSILNEKVFVCNHCHGIIAFESDFYKDK